MEYQYDVCFSFASEQLFYVEKVYEHLSKNNIKVFFDRSSDIEMELWGTNLLEQFYSVYKKQSRFCIMFISKEYAEKAWTRFERRSALERAFEKDEVYILPVRFDDTELPGLHGATKYINADQKTPSELSDLIIRKVKKDISHPQIVFSDMYDQIYTLFHKYDLILEQQNQGKRIAVYKNQGDQLDEFCSALIEVDSNGTNCILVNIDLFPGECVVTECSITDLIRTIEEAINKNG